MKNETNHILTKAFITIAAGAILLAASPFSTLAQSNQTCYVPPDETVVKWKTMYTEPCEYFLLGMCLWPLRHAHVAYKVTVTDGVPLRNHQGKLIAAASGEEQADWATYDSAEWNVIEYIPFQRVMYPDYEPVAENEYVVMVETRYRLFHNVDSTLGICTQQP